MDLESGLIVPLPEATPVVAKWRDRLDAAAALGVPAHVTVLYPFLPPDRIDTPVLAALGKLFAQVEPFDVELIDVGWFGRDVVYLAPSPDAPFRRMTAHAFARWPQCPPYGGLHGEPTPHLTIGDQGSVEERLEAASEVARHLPVDARATEVWLMAGSASTTWNQLAAFSLGR